MSMVLEVGGQLVPVKCESGASHGWSAPSSLHTMIDGTRWAPRAARASLDLSLEWGVSRPNDHAALLALAHGEYGQGPFRLLDSTAAVTNALSADVSLLGPFVGASYAGIAESGAVTLDDGNVAGRSLAVTSASGVSLTPGALYGALAPAAGEWVTVSAFVLGSTGAGVRVQHRWFTAEGLSVVSSSATRPAATFGPLTRVSYARQVPESVSPSGGVPGPVTRVGLTVLDVARVARPAVSWTSEVTEWGVGGSPRYVMIEPPSLSTIMALRETKGLRASSVQVRAFEVGAR